MADIVLSSAIRSNLLSLQNTASLLSKTQERLSTGLKVGSALDDPTAFFTAQSLSSRANDLNRLLDSVGLAVESLNAADDAISAITDLVESAQATARQAQQSATGTLTAPTVTGTTAIAADTSATHTSTGIDYTTDPDLSALNGETLSINGNVVYTFTAAAAGQLAALVTAIDGVAGVSATVVGTDLQVSSDDTTSDLTIAFSNATVGTATGLTAGTYEPANATLGALAGDITFQVASGAVKTITFGTNDGANEVNNLAELTAALTGLSGGTLSIDGTNHLSATTSNADDSITVGGDAGILTALGFTAGTVAPTVVTASTERSNLQSQYNALLTQIDQLAQDAGFNGINLLQSDNLSVIFNESGTSSLTISGVDFDSGGLAINAVAGDGFQINSNIETSLSELDSAVSSLRTQASTFGSNLSVVETRQNFTKNLITTLESGAAGLTLADTNEEGANLLALQTRQQLSTVALSLASQAEQNVLRLF